MENVISDVADFIKRYKNVSNVRFTLGKYTEKFGFEKHLFQKEKYQSVLSLLNSNPHWDDKKETVSEKNNKVPCKIIDTIIYKIKNSPYDLIVTSESKKNQECYISDEYIKKETSFFRKCHIFQISYENSIQDGDVFNFNLNFRKNENTDTYNSHSSLLKILDIIKAVDKDNPCEYVFEKL
tara:strand:+ start:4869 stop:5411 length:543 start_codon:yes stop_codon:yes gene_type:complete